jgi:hypothetical protein
MKLVKPMSLATISRHARAAAKAAPQRDRAALLAIAALARLAAAPKK